MNFDQPKDPSSEMKIDYGGKALKDFEELEEQKRAIEESVRQSYDLGLDPSSAIPDGKGNVIVYGTQLMDLDEFNEYKNTLSSGRNRETLLMAERKRVAFDHHILNEEEVEMGPDYTWCFHGSTLEKISESLIPNK